MEELKKEEETTLSLKEKCRELQIAYKAKIESKIWY